MNNKGVFTTYCSEEAHSSVDNSIKFAGLGIENLRKIPVYENFALTPSKLEKAIEKDLKDNFISLCVFGTMGTTSSTPVDLL